MKLEKKRGLLLNNMDIIVNLGINFSGVHEERFSPNWSEMRSKNDVR